MGGDKSGLEISCAVSDGVLVRTDANPATLKKGKNERREEQNAIQTGLKGVFRYRLFC